MEGRVASSLITLAAEFRWCFYVSVRQGKQKLQAPPVASASVVTCLGLRACYRCWIVFATTHADQTDQHRTTANEESLNGARRGEGHADVVCQCLMGKASAMLILLLQQSCHHTANDPHKLMLSTQCKPRLIRRVRHRFRTRNNQRLVCRQVSGVEHKAKSSLWWTVLWDSSGDYALD
eukprot:6465037-Amphidinium_carterae.1